MYEYRNLSYLINSEFLRKDFDDFFVWEFYVLKFIAICEICYSDMISVSVS